MIRRSGNRFADKIMRQVKRSDSRKDHTTSCGLREGRANETRLLVALTRPEAEADPVAVAEMAAVDPLIGHAAALVGRVVSIAAADLSAVGLPQPINDQPGAGQDRRAIGEMHRAQRLPGERP